MWSQHRALFGSTRQCRDTYITQNTHEQPLKIDKIDTRILQWVSMLLWFNGGSVLWSEISIYCLFYMFYMCCTDLSFWAASVFGVQHIGIIPLLLCFQNKRMPDVEEEQKQMTPKEKKEKKTPLQAVTSPPLVMSFRDTNMLVDYPFTHL